METPKSFRIKYEVHCRLENFFGKEIVVKKCYSELHAKVKLNDFCVKKYGKEFDFIKVVSIKCEIENLLNAFDNIFGEKSIFDNAFTDLLKTYKK